MENGEGHSLHLRPHFLPPLGIANPESGTFDHKTSEKSVRQRIGTPAPRKKSPIPDDLELDNMDGLKGNPLIKVDAVDGLQKSIFNKGLKSLPEEALLSGCGNNIKCRLPNKPQLEPIKNGSGANRGNSNGNDITRRCPRQDATAGEKANVSDKHIRLKPIVKRNSLSESGGKA